MKWLYIVLAKLIRVFFPPSQFCSHFYGKYFTGCQWDLVTVESMAVRSKPGGRLAELKAQKRMQEVDDCETRLYMLVSSH